MGKKSSQSYQGSAYVLVSKLICFCYLMTRVVVGSGVCLVSVRKSTRYSGSITKPQSSSNNIQVKWLSSKPRVSFLFLEELPSLLVEVSSSDILPLS
jgi:hypothetical protein